MKRELVDLKKEYGIAGGTLESIAIDYPFDASGTEWKRPAVIVVPGGGYGFVSKREGEPVAAAFLARGFQTFVLTYTVWPDSVYPDQLIELAAAVDYVKKNAEKYGVNPDEVFVVGFSAGGHLCANLAVEYADVSKKAGIELNAKPTAAGLSYPVIAKKYGHTVSHDRLLDGYTDEAKAELMQVLELDDAVTKDTAPAFIWSTTEDTCVPPINSLRFAEALMKNGVACELHVYPNGQHGLSTCDHEVNVGPNRNYLAKNTKWLDDCAAFFRLFVKEEF